jgi:asparagine synthase (glutamine-hydrolysing)
LRACWDETAGLEPAVHRIWRLFIAQRLRRETAMSLVEFDSVAHTRLPYLDNELVDEVFAAPPELKLGDSIQAHILRRRRPDFLNIVNVNTGTVVGAGQLKRSIARFRMKVLAKLGVKGYQPYERMGLWLRRELRPTVQRLLTSDRCLDRGIFDPQTVRTVVANHLSGRGNHTFLILALLIFEMSQRMFTDNDEPQSAAESNSLAAVSAA